ncbi:MAG: hypothetical protein QM503_10925 [Bacteroidota bacterium]
MVRYVTYYLLALSLLIINNTTQAQSIDKWKSGSASNLTDDVLLLVCFISTPNDNWSSVEKTEMLNNLVQTENWLKEQSQKYDVKINFKQVLLNEGNDIIFDTIEPGLASGKERVDWVYRVIKKIGYCNSKQACRKIRSKYNVDNIIVIIIAHGNGRPYSMQYAKGINKKKYFTEGMIVYNKYLSGAPMPTTAVLAHELLHLFGAWDLYKTYAQTYDRQIKAHELYPNDIMLRIDHNINTLEIDNLTAWQIGWKNNQEDIFEWFRPSDYKK